MAGFYDEMADMARELLAPESAGGLGQGVITVVRTEQTPKPDDWPTWEPWNGVETVKTYLLRGAVSNVARELVGGTGMVDGTTILASDMVLICADWMALISTQTGDDDPVTSNTVVPFALAVPEVVNVNGLPFTTLQRVPIPGAGVKAAHKFIIRG